MEDEMMSNPADFDPADNSAGTATADAAASERLEVNPADHQVKRRALLPEEEQAGSDDPEAQADAILEESEHRQRDRSGTAAEHRRSDDVVSPPD